MKLSIAIPAYNEEQSIEGIINRTLIAREQIVENSPVTDVQITVVSDGSTDRTVELASRYLDRIKLIVFKENRGYGAAIMQAWEQSDADLLGILDADGTCDPNFFVDLCTMCVKTNADVVIGCRLNPRSKMPFLRVVGNIIFAIMLTFFSSTRVRDAASGMRVVRRSSLPKLKPLPNGMHFTPAMSARAILSQDLKIVEIDMPYQEREGKSKLRTVRDGVQFLRVIMEAALLYRPSRPLQLLGCVCLTIAASLMITPTIYYLQHRAVLEWMIYRFIVSELMGVSAHLLFCVSYLSEKIVKIVLGRESTAEGFQSFLERFFSSPLFWFAPLFLTLAGCALVFGSFIELVSIRATYEHWSRFIAMSFLFLLALILAVTRVLDFCLDLLASRSIYLKSLRRISTTESDEAKIALQI